MRNLQWRIENVSIKKSVSSTKNTANQRSSPNNARPVHPRIFKASEAEKLIPGCSNCTNNSALTKLKAPINSTRKSVALVLEMVLSYLSILTTGPSTKTSIKLNRKKTHISSQTGRSLFSTSAAPSTGARTKRERTPCLQLKKI